MFLDCPPAFGAAHGQCSRGRRSRHRARAGRVLRARRALAAARVDQPRQGAAQSAARRRGDPADDGRRPHPPRRPGRGRSCGGISASSSSRRPCPARSASPRRRATGCPRSPTTAAPPARRRTGRWRWSLSSVSDTPRRGLGRGLEVLIGGAGEAELLHLPVEAVHANPRQPRRRFEPEATAGPGRIDPPPGRATAGRRASATRRRLRADRGRAPLARRPRGRACRRFRRSSGEADDRDTLLLGLVENVARENLSPVEEARAYAILIDEFELSLGDVAERVGRSKPSVSNRLRLLELPEEVLWMLARGELTEGHARAVLALPDDDARRRLAKRIARDGMTVRAAEKAAQDGGARRRRTRPRRSTRRSPIAHASRRTADRPAGPGQRRQARDPLRRRDRPRGARRGARSAASSRVRVRYTRRVPAGD